MELPPAAVIVGRKGICRGWRRRLVGVSVGTGGLVCVAVATLVGTPVGVMAGGFVRVVVAVGVFVGAVLVGVAVAAPMGVLVSVPLGVGVQGGIRTPPDPELITGPFVPESVPVTPMTSLKTEIAAWQAGAVSSTLPSQMSPGALRLQRGPGVSADAAGDHRG
jgi:hypothetical protein